MAHGPRKKWLDFGGNPDQVTLGLRLGQPAGLVVDVPRHIRKDCVTVR